MIKNVKSICTMYMYMYQEGHKHIFELFLALFRYLVYASVNHGGKKKLGLKSLSSSNTKKITDFKDAQV